MYAAVQCTAVYTSVTFTRYYNNTAMFIWSDFTLHYQYQYSALIAVSQLFCGLPNDILPALTTGEVKPFVKGEMEDIGLDYMTSAATAGDVNSILYLAHAFDTGLNLGSDRKVILLCNPTR